MTLGSRLKAHTVALLAILVVGCGTSSFTTGVRPEQGLKALDMEEAGAKSGFHAYFGIQHTHVAENGDDGQGTLAEAYAFARDQAKLDFLGVSSHAHMITDDGYESLKRASSQFTQNGKFVALLAQEWSSISKGGHINIFEANARCPVDNGDWTTFYQRWLPAHPEVAWCQFNHPHPGDNVLEFGGSGFSPVAAIPASRVALDKFAGMALLNGPGKYEGTDMKGAPDEWDRGLNGLNYEEEYKEFLNRGWRVGAVGDQDNHVKSWGLACETRTGVWAKSLTKAEIVAAFRARRTFATFDHNLKLWFALNGQPMGGEVAGGKELSIEVAASDPDSTIERLELYGDTDGAGGKPASLVAKVAVGKKSALWSFKLPATGQKGYYFAKVVYGDRAAWAWSSPVWVTDR
ncbi:MAG TPA: CehA/McbA family metallohydrolase [Stenomitos sp.]